MAHVHEQLYASQSFSQVEMGPYISELVRRLAHTYRSAGRRIDVRTDVQNIRLSIERAVPCAQILHELITNSLKHAFTDRDHGRVDVRMSNGDGNLITLEVRDDGSGMRPDASDAGSESLGMKLIEILSRQLDGSAAFENTNGTAFRLQFPKDNRRA
jgi:two-component sensor histidine kinase